MAIKNMRSLMLLFAVSLGLVHGGNPPANPKASPEARALLEYLYSQSGKSILSGQHENNNQPKLDWTQIQEKSGKMPAILGQDFGWGGDIDKWRKILVDKAIDKWTKDGVISTISWHNCAPVEKWADDKCGWSDLNKGQPASLIDNMLKSGTAENRIWLDKIDKMAVYMKQLQDAKVPVLWRPFHEMNGGWFWWGKQARFKDMWINLYDRLTNHHKINNLIWVWSPNAETGITDRFEKAYPGHKYVDVLGMDIYEAYGHKYEQSHHDKLLALGEGRPIALCEIGKMPDVEALKKTQPKWVWFLVWSGFISHSSRDWINQVYGHPRVLTNEEVKIPQAATRLASDIPASVKVEPRVFVQFDGTGRPTLLVKSPRGTHRLDIDGQRTEARPGPKSR